MAAHPAVSLLAVLLFVCEEVLAVLAASESVDEQPQDSRSLFGRLADTLLKVCESADPRQNNCFWTSKTMKAFANQGRLCSDMAGVEATGELPELTLRRHEAKWLAAVAQGGEAKVAFQWIGLKMAETYAGIEANYGTHMFTLVHSFHEDSAHMICDSWQEVHGCRCTEFQKDTLNTTFDPAMHALAGYQVLGFEPWWNALQDSLTFIGSHRAQGKLVPADFSYLHRLFLTSHEAVTHHLVQYGSGSPTFMTATAVTAESWHCLDDQSILIQHLAELEQPGYGHCVSFLAALTARAASPQVAQMISAIEAALCPLFLRRLVGGVLAVAALVLASCWPLSKLWSGRFDSRETVRYTSGTDGL